MGTIWYVNWWVHCFLKPFADHLILRSSNMGAEIGATTSLFPFNDRMYDYLAATKRKQIGDFARSYAAELKEDEGCVSLHRSHLCDINISNERIMRHLLVIC